MPCLAYIYVSDISSGAAPCPALPCPTASLPGVQLLDELQELTNQSQDLDVALIDKKIDQVRRATRSGWLLAGSQVRQAGLRAAGGNECTP